MAYATERTRRMVEMHAQGATLQEIGDAFGISRQRVYQMISPHIHKTAERCIFPGLRRWMLHNCSPRELRQEAGIGCSMAAFYHKLKGRNQFTMSEIKAIMEYTGEPFEALFGEVDEP